MMRRRTWRRRKCRMSDAKKFPSEIENMNDDTWMIEGPDALDDGIIGVVRALRNAGIDTSSSCDGHMRERPTVWFTGDENEGERAEMVATEAGFQVFHVSRFW